MFVIGLIIGSYAYLIFLLGLLSLLQKEVIILFTTLFILSLVFSLKKHVLKIFNKLSKLKLGLSLKQVSHNKLNTLIICLITLQTLINLAGALSPEIAFDALWYHLTLPKIYLEKGSIDFIPGDLFYYSVMPKLIDMLYIPALMFQGEQIAKFTHFTFGALTTITVYCVAKRYLKTRYALLSSLIFYSNLVVSWQSTTAFIDLGRTFYEILAL